MNNEKTLKKKGRGAYDCWIEKKTGVTAVGWLDNRMVLLTSTYAGCDPIKVIKRFDFKAKKYVNVDCPNIVTEYNTNMGGVDKFDMLMSLYRCDYKSKKYYRRIFFWCINLCVVNSWLLYKRDCDRLDIQKGKRLDLLSFAIQISESLILQGKSKKEGNRSLNPVVTQPNIRFDRIAHWPDMVETKKRRRCRVCHCLTQNMCIKCDAALCIRPIRNCFKLYHTNETV